MSKYVESLVTGMMKSHAECFGQKMSYPKNLCHDYEVRGIDEVVVNGRVVKKSVVKTIHPQDFFSGFKSDDFALENIIAVGALDSLEERYLSAITTSELSDGMECTIDNVINSVDAAESASQTNDGGNV
jgi:hypothetical protein